MDKAELFSKDDSGLKTILNGINCFSDIFIDFRLDKCAKLTFKKGRIIESHHNNFGCPN